MDYIALFTSYLKDRKSPLTAKNYLHTMEHYLLFLKGEVPSESNAEQFLSYLSHKGNEARSLNRHLCALKSFFKYILRQEIIIESYRFDKKLPIWLDEDERNKFLAACQTPFEKAISMVFIYGGLRVQETANLEINKVTVLEEDGTGYLTIMGKGGREEVVAVPSNVIKAINEYLSIRNGHSNLVFPRGVRAIQGIIKEIGERAKLSKKVTPHTLRHTAATRLRDKGFDISEIKEHLRHRSITTTSIYVHIKPDEIRDKLEKTK